jgi:hypothetical protein
MLCYVMLNIRATKYVLESNYGWVSNSSRYWYRNCKQWPHISKEIVTLRYSVNKKGEVKGQDKFVPVLN